MKLPMSLHNRKEDDNYPTRDNQKAPIESRLFPGL